MSKGDDELIRMTATEAVSRLKAGHIQPIEMVEAAATRIVIRSLSRPLCACGLTKGSS